MIVEQFNKLIEFDKKYEKYQIFEKVTIDKAKTIIGETLDGVLIKVLINIVEEYLFIEKYTIYI